jgi:serine-type D-Ala-D-Ala carboxypeptidase (penicillin-binding protein 5/6)
MSCAIKGAAITLCILLACTSAPFVSRGHEADIRITGHVAVLMDTRTGRILWRRNQDIPLAPASTTKILTALLVLERSRISDFVTVPVEATKTTGGSARLRAGERLTVEQLLYGMMLGSANDAAIALAHHAAGSQRQFVTSMNDKARSLGALRSSFRNPTGLPQKGNVTTAHDLAVITRAALANSDFRTVVAARSYPWQSAAWKGELRNSNLLLESYPGAMGVKTGQTREAGFCLVVAAARGETSLLAGILKSTEVAVWQDARTLLDYGFAGLRSER